MAAAKKCDVCGKFYDVYNHKQDPNNPNGIMFVNIDGKGDYYRGTPTDLCPSCLTHVKSFIAQLRLYNGKLGEAYETIINAGKACANCIHRDCKGGEEPCHSCDEYDNWEAMTDGLF